jgi:hypothetical protein
MKIMPNRLIAVLNINYTVVPLNQFKTAGYANKNKKFWEELTPYLF